MCLVDNIMIVILKTPVEVMQDLSKKAKERRLSLNLSQEGVCLRSGVSLGSLKRFETSGQISLESLLKLAHALNCLSDFEQVFRMMPDRGSLFGKSKEAPKRRRGRL